VNLVRYADRPDLREQRSLTAQVFPEFLNHHALAHLWPDVYTRFPAFQVALLDDDVIVAEAHALPIPWDGTVDGLPVGWEAAFEAGMASGLGPTALSMLAISVLPERQGEGLGARMLAESVGAARTAGLGAVLACVRPTLKERYPLIPIEAYMTWRRPDGAHFDPWIRLHERAGGEIMCEAPGSMAIEAPVSDWESWMKMAFPADGDYVAPGMLAPLVVRSGIGRHVEPNVWVCHRT
jgi:ribosomal protein S18 acetylase RimI-like enzyme